MLHTCEPCPFLAQTMLRAARPHVCRTQPRTCHLLSFPEERARGEMARAVSRVVKWHAPWAVWGSGTRGGPYGVMARAWTEIPPLAVELVAEDQHLLGGGPLRLSVPQVAQLGTSGKQQLQARSRVPPGMHERQARPSTSQREALTRSSLRGFELVAPYGGGQPEFPKLRKATPPGAEAMCGRSEQTAFSFECATFHATHHEMYGSVHRLFVQSSAGVSRSMKASIDHWASAGGWAPGVLRSFSPHTEA
jgi:hypothetical protein